MRSPANRVLRWQLVCAVAIAGVFAREGVARAEEPTLDEVRYHPTELPPDGTRTRLLIAGAALTVGWYGAAVGTSYLYPDAPNASDLRVPVVGPWLALRDVSCGEKERSCSTGAQILRTALAVVSGVGQFGGLLALTEGLFLNTSSGAAAPASPAEREGRAARAGESHRSVPNVAAVPLLLPSGAGVEFVGRF